MCVWKLFNKNLKLSSKITYQKQKENKKILKTSVPMQNKNPFLPTSKPLQKNKKIFQNPYPKQPENWYFQISCNLYLRHFSLKI